MMRKIAANYILLPGYPLVKNGYVTLEGRKVIDVVDTGSRIREIQGLEFYGGFIVSALLLEKARAWQPGKEILPCIELLYADITLSPEGLALVQGIDYTRFCWTAKASITSLV